MVTGMPLAEREEISLENAFGSPLPLLPGFIQRKGRTTAGGKMNSRYGGPPSPTPYQLLPET
ncbi:hypothetical protein [Paenibacillus campinasensis]|uniref:Uncharacterized protein n=1 Tax=Paenibacillus campinasensis TaxID=66347 RepID=A0A268ELU7_9BACL|nr:hypothetical protein [Paenibacillus campinasensis]PAD74093.1 hypothetical protein CHH67_18475 [Paenibacillus campinasensis]